MANSIVVKTEMVTFVPSEDQFNPNLFIVTHKVIPYLHDVLAQKHNTLEACLKERKPAIQKDPAFLNTLGCFELQTVGKVSAHAPLKDHQ